MPDHKAAAITHDAAPTAKRQRQTPDQRVAKLRAQLARATAQQQKRSRQMETREKIVIGGTVVKAMRTDAELRERIVALLRADVTRDIDREAIAPWLSATSTPL